MPLILDLEKAYADGQGRSGIPSARWTAISRIMSDGRRRSISPSG